MQKGEINYLLWIPKNIITHKGSTEERGEGLKFKAQKNSHLRVFYYIFFLRKDGTSKSSCAGAGACVGAGVILESLTAFLPNGLVIWALAFEVST